MSVEERDHSQEVLADVKFTLELFLQELDAKMWPEFIWGFKGLVAGFCGYRMKFCVFEMRYILIS